MTDISVTRESYTAESRAWLAGPHGTEPGTTPSIVLDLSLFTDAKFADVIKSGCVVGRVTTTGLYGPYDDTATDGRQVAARLTFNSHNRKGKTSGKIGDAGVIHAFINEAKLPYTAGVGALDSAAKTDLKHLVLV